VTETVEHWSGMTCNSPAPPRFPSSYLSPLQPHAIRGSPLVGLGRGSPPLQCLHKSTTCNSLPARAPVKPQISFPVHIGPFFPKLPKEHKSAGEEMRSGDAWGDELNAPGLSRKVVTCTIIEKVT
jgi:hypothetical protein